MNEIIEKEMTDDFIHFWQWKGLLIAKGHKQHFTNSVFNTEKECQNYIDDFINKAKEIIKNGIKVTIVTHDNKKISFSDVIIIFPYPVQK